MEGVFDVQVFMFFFSVLFAPCLLPSWHEGLMRSCGSCLSKVLGCSRRLGRAVKSSPDLGRVLVVSCRMVDGCS